MALETIDRIEDARSIYGKLAAVSWNQKIRRNALQLISGLDIVKQIRSDVKSSNKPSMDPLNMKRISQAFEKGLVNEWDSYKKATKYNAWYDDGFGSKKVDIVKADTIYEAYNLFLQEITPLKKVSSDLLQKAFRRMYITEAAEKANFVVSRGAFSKKRLEATEIVATRKVVTAEIPDASTLTVSGTLLSTGPKDNPVPMSQRFYDGAKDGRRVVKTDSDTNIVERMTPIVNGTWELVTALMDKGR